MVQKIDNEENENKDSKKSIKNPSTTKDKNQPHQLGKSVKEPDHKTGKTISRKFDPSGLPKYR